MGRDANEMYLLPAPEGLVGKDFVELTGMFARHRGDRKSCLLIGIQRGEEMHLNPIGGEAGPLNRDDQLILLAASFSSRPRRCRPILPSPPRLNRRNPNPQEESRDHPAQDLFGR